MKYLISGVLQLAVVIAVAVGLAAIGGALYFYGAGVTAHRAFTLAYYVGGGILLVLAVVGHGAENRLFRLDRRGRLASMLPPDTATLNPTGAFIIAAIALLAIGVVLDANLN